jgi:hypothetical protein
MSAISRRLFLTDAPLGLAASALNLKAFAASESGAPHFEVASIRPSPPGATVQQAHFSTPFGVADRFDAEGVTVGDILDMLNGWQLGRVLGGPAWMRTDRYDIHAKAGTPISSEERKSAVMALLAERFQLVAHRETRDIPAAVLLALKPPAGFAGAFDFSLAPSAIEPVRGQTWGDLVREAMSDFGFKVETRKVPPQVTVVDRCERPSEN